MREKDKHGSSEQEVAIALGIDHDAPKIYDLICNYEVRTATENQPVVTRTPNL